MLAAPSQPFLRWSISKWFERHAANMTVAGSLE